jgi:hypothetical protein
VSAARTIAHIVGSVSLGVQVVVILVGILQQNAGILHGLPVMYVWKPIVCSTLLAFAGSIYAAVKGNPRWFIVTVVEALMLLLFYVVMMT